MEADVIVDADSMIYASAITSEDLSEAKTKLDFAINQSLNDLQNQGVEVFSLIICSGSKGNFRKLITGSYKANRKSELPELLAPLHKYCIEKWYSQWSYGVETDDLVASLWHKSTESGNKCIIVSIDKDYMQLPALIWSYRRKEMLNLSELDALRAFYTQMIVGDSADNIKVCNGKGKVFAKKLLSDKTTKYQIVKAVYGVYREIYKSKARQRYTEAYHLLKLRTDVQR